MNDLCGVSEAAASRLGRAMAGGGDRSKRQADDYYPTPGDVTRAFLRVESQRLVEIGGQVWEPCGRGGAIVRELQAAGFDTVATDLVPDPGNGVAGLDVLLSELALAPAVVTNPPFNIAAEIIAHLLGRLEIRYLALLLKSQFWHADERRSLFRTWQPARIYALTWRPDFLGGGAPVMECQWCVWDKGHDGPTAYDLLARQSEGAQGRLFS